ncbi:MAG: Ig-like domain-containing protein [Candidatus Cryptobacteroides sp.]
MKRLVLILAAAMTMFAACNPEVEVSSVTLNPDNINGVMTAEVLTGVITATVAPSDATNTVLVWSSSDENVVVVNQKGEYELKGVGTALITATASNGKSGECRVTVGSGVIAVTGITVEPSSLKLIEGAFATLQATVLPEEADNREVEWVSSDATIATVDENGVVTALKTGECEISAVSKENSEITGVCKLSVVEPVVELAGVKYRIRMFANGQTWMVENLRYVPEGLTLDADVSKGGHVYYPYEVVDKKAVALTDEASIAKYGLLYDYQAVFGTEITADNFQSFEGKRGICPEGWHIPTKADIKALVGNVLGDAADNADAPFYEANYKGGNINKSNGLGFNFNAPGAVNGNTLTAALSYGTVLCTEYVPAEGDNKASGNCSVAEFIGRPSMSYFMGSTGYKVITNKENVMTNIQFFSLNSMFITNSPEGKYQGGYSNVRSGQSVRCVKDAE